MLRAKIAKRLNHDLVYSFIPRTTTLPEQGERERGTVLRRKQQAGKECSRGTVGSGGRPSLNGSLGCYATVGLARAHSAVIIVNFSIDIYSVGRTIFH